MTQTLGRRALAGAAALPFLASIGTARAQPATESTFERVRRAKAPRIAVLPGELPYFVKDLASGQWSGACIEMATDIAKVFDAKLEFVESTYGNSVLDLQSNKVDLAFALNPTPARALSIGFSHPMIIHPFGCVARKGLNPKTWSDLNKPEVRIVYDIGSLHETAAKRYCAKAQLTGFKSRDECTLNLQSGRADVHILAAILGLSAVGKNPALGTYHLLTEPLVALPSCLGLQREADTRFREVVDAWLDMNRGNGQIREWMLEGLGKAGVPADQVPAALTF
ncbi:MAG: transporter substrate-binding domain-containing protein [Acetobacteraceae bacterium]|nr:transporter substrate-binding domain-containing protein [Acetobacteraceae bacterium]